MLGSPFSGVNNVKVSLKSSNSAITDQTKNTKLSKDNSVLTFSPVVSELSLGVYQVLFEVETKS